MKSKFASALIFCILQFLVAGNVHAQHYSWEDFLEKISTDDENEYGNWDTMLDELAELHENPFNLNEATKEDLEQLPFLNEDEIEEILAYVYRYGPLQTLGELKLVEGLDYQKRQFLTLFVYLAQAEKQQEKIKLSTLLKEGRNELLARLDVPLYQREGYKRPDDEVIRKNPNKIYLGNDLYHNLRYQYNYRNKVYWGLVAEKDAGEPFGSYGNKPYDFYSFHFLLRDCGKLKVLALGDYRLAFGEGLVVNTGFSFGKMTLLESGDRRTNIKKASSTYETSFFRGAAATCRFGQFEVSAFVSRLPVDATLKSDGTISTLKTDGLHRTQLELSKKHNVTEQALGADFTWKNTLFELGLTGFYQHFDTPFSTGTELYRRYYPSGKDFVNLGAHYRFRYYRFLFAGETAFSDVHRGWATLNRMSFRFSHRFSVVALQRLFTYQYTGLRAKCFSEGNQVSNESGFYAGVEVKPVNGLKVQAYADYFYFPWYKYGISHSSEGAEGNIQVDWAPYRSKWNVSGFYQVKRKERNDIPYIYNKVKVNLQYFPVDGLNLRLWGRYTGIHGEDGSRTHGYMLGTIARWIEKKDRFRVSLSYAYFDSEDYKAPMSFYEPSLLYAFSFVSLYGRGMRASLGGRCAVSSHWVFMLKYGLTAYLDRDAIGTGLQRIDSNKKNDLYFLARFIF